MIFMDETKKVDFITDKWISLRTSGFVNLLVRRTSRFFDEIRALVTPILAYMQVNVISGKTHGTYSSRMSVFWLSN